MELRLAVEQCTTASPLPRRPGILLPACLFTTIRIVSRDQTYLDSFATRFRSPPAHVTDGFASHTAVVVGNGGPMRRHGSCAEAARTTMSSGDDPAACTSHAPSGAAVVAVKIETRAENAHV